MTWLTQYGEAVLNGEIVACEKIKQVYRTLLDKYEHPAKYKPYVFDEESANFPIEFIETFCKQSSGILGAPLKLELFQKAKHQAVFGFIDEDTGFRQYREVLDIRGRKNGKTTELAADSFYLLLADGEGAPEIYFIATTLEQSKKAFTEAINMRHNSSALIGATKKRVADIYCPDNRGFMRALASNTNSLDGLNSHAVTIDELAAIKNRDTYDLMKQSTQAKSRKQPLISCITTNGFVRGSIFDSQYEYACGVLDGRIKDNRFLPFIYELDNRDEWKDRTKWIKANPGLGPIKDEEELANNVKKAKNDPGFLPTVLVKDFNLKENAATRWLTWNDLNNEETFDWLSMNFMYGIGGIDKADTTDLNAAKILCMKPDDCRIYVRSMYWIPEARLNEITQDGNRREIDNAPYRLWASQGYLRTWPGNKVDGVCFYDWFTELYEKENLIPYKIGYDPWRIDDSLLRMFVNTFGKNTMVEVRQGTKSLSMPMNELKPDLQSKRIIYNNNPIDKWCLSNMEERRDINGNSQPVRGSDSRQKIDGGMALLDAYAVLRDNKDDYINLISMEV